MEEIIEAIKAWAWSRLKTAMKIILVTKNWLNVWMSLFLLKRPVRAVFRSGYAVPVTPRERGKFISYASFFRHFPDGEITGSIATITYLSRKLSFDFGTGAPGVLAEFFGKRFPYTILFDTSLIRGRVVLDIGAGLGDSLIWFAAHNAKKVYAFEPLSSYYELCRRNIELNGLGGLCEVVQAGIGGKTSNDFFACEASRQIMGLGIGLEDERKPNIPIFTLDDVVRRYSIKPGAFLKIDCEGYEYDIILKTSNENLRLFDYIMMEYHYGYERLKSKLEKAGFHVRHTIPQRGFKKMRLGYIFASRF